jgi:hypothetical protein
MTGLQLWVGRDYQRSNDEQQTRVEKLLIDQLEESRRFNRQLTEDVGADRKMSHFCG